MNRSASFRSGSIGFLAAAWISLGQLVCLASPNTPTTGPALPPSIGGASSAARTGGAGSTASIIDGWTMLADPGLDRLVGQAAVQNLDLRAAATRVRQARSGRETDDRSIQTGEHLGVAAVPGRSKPPEERSGVALGLFQAVEASPSATAIASTTGALEYVNRRFQACTEALERGQVLAQVRGGKMVHLVGTISPVSTPEARVTSMIAVFQDVTQAMEMNRHWRQAEKMEALGALACRVAQDSNNVLAAIMTASELLERQLGHDPAVRPKLEIIQQATKRGKELNQRILAFGRQSEAFLDPFDLSRVVEEVAALVCDTFPESISIRTEIAPSIRVVGDPCQIRQMLLNLALNGSQAMMEHGGTLSLGLSGLATRAEPNAPRGLGAGPFALLTVTDTGCGMSAEILEKIFEPFFTTRRQGEGTGLGLSEVHGIVHRHGGSIQVDSVPGLGTSFRVHLPRSLPDAEGLRLQERRHQGRP